jgi:hypothetical protein
VSVSEWLSAYTIPRDGAVIAVIHLRAGQTVPQADCLQFGIHELDTGPEDAWFCPGDGGVYDYAKDMDPRIVGWFPLPQIAGW